MSNQDVILKLQAIESALQDQEHSTTDLKHLVDELKDIVQDLDKNMAIQAEKQSHLFFRIEQLQGELKAMEAKGEKGNDRQRALIENALMVVLGGLISYLFGLIGK